MLVKTRMSAKKNEKLLQDHGFDISIALMAERGRLNPSRDEIEAGTVGGS